MKKPKRFSEAHTPPSSIGMGDHYGRGVKNPVGRVRMDSYTNVPNTPMTDKKMGIPPKALA